MNTPVVALIVLAKAPVPGQVKTRLKAELSARDASEVATAALLSTMEQAQRLARTDRRIRLVLALSGSLARAVHPAPLLTAIAGPRRWRMVQQRGSGLAERIVAAHLDAGFGGPTLQIGMDTPQITAELLADAVDRLLAPGVDAVLGPATDGGWWALGLRDPGQATAIAAVPMSTASTGTLTCKALTDRGLRVSNLPELRDVDTVADLFAVADAMPCSAFARLVRRVGVSAA